MDVAYSRHIGLVDSGKGDMLCFVASFPGGSLRGFILSVPRSFVRFVIEPTFVLRVSKLATGTTFDFAQVSTVFDIVVLLSAELAEQMRALRLFGCVRRAPRVGIGDSTDQ